MEDRRITESHSKIVGFVCSLQPEGEECCQKKKLPKKMRPVCVRKARECVCVCQCVHFVLQNFLKFSLILFILMLIVGTHIIQEKTAAAH